MYRYYFIIYTKYHPEDGDTVWVPASSESEARDRVYADYHSIIRVELIGRKKF